MEEAKQDLSRVWIDEPKSLFQFLDSYKDLESKVVANLQEQKLLDLVKETKSVEDWAAYGRIGQHFARRRTDGRRK